MDEILRVREEEEEALLLLLVYRDTASSRFFVIVVQETVMSVRLTNKCRSLPYPSLRHLPYSNLLNYFNRLGKATSLYKHQCYKSIRVWTHYPVNQLAYLWD